MPEPISPHPTTPTFWIAIFFPHVCEFRCLRREQLPRKSVPEVSAELPVRQFPKTSTIMAIPWPPPMHAVARPFASLGMISTLEARDRAGFASLLLNLGDDHGVSPALP